MTGIIRIILKYFTLFTAVGTLAEPTHELNVGDPAPAFEANDDAGNPWKLADRIGKKVLVVYFYPADMTSGCTKQACAYRDDRSTFDALNAEVVGISGDTEGSHRLFKKAYNLNFTLLSDPKGALAQKFGVPLKAGATFTQTIDGKEEVFAREVSARRWTFIIDQNGKIAYKDTEVKASGDSRKVLEVVKNLSAR